MPRIIATAAPKDAPLETPRVKGDARGLRRIVCMMHPLIPRDMPVKAHREIRGIRT